MRKSHIPKIVFIICSQAAIESSSLLLLLTIIIGRSSIEMVGIEVRWWGEKDNGEVKMIQQIKPEKRAAAENMLEDSFIYRYYLPSFYLF